MAYADDLGYRWGGLPWMRSWQAINGTKLCPSGRQMPWFCLGLPIQCVNSAMWARAWAVLTQLARLTTKEKRSRPPCCLDNWCWLSPNNAYSQATRHWFTKVSLSYYIWQRLEVCHPLAIRKAFWLTSRAMRWHFLWFWPSSKPRWPLCPGCLRMTVKMRMIMMRIRRKTRLILRQLWPPGPFAEIGLWPGFAPRSHPKICGRYTRKNWELACGWCDVGDWKEVGWMVEGFFCSFKIGFLICDCRVLTKY